MIIDSHVHIGRMPNTPLVEMSFEQITRKILKEMKVTGVDHALILPVPEVERFTLGMKKPDAPTVQEALRLTKGLKNLHVLGSIDVLNYKKSDLDQLDDFLRRRQIHGLKLYLGYEHFYPTDKKAWPIYKLCIKHDVPVLFHAGDTLSLHHGAKVRYAHPLNFDDLAVDFPDLKIVIAHLGNPWLVDCAEVIYKNSNVYADVSGLFVASSDTKSNYGKMIRSRIKDLIIYAGAGKLLYGTDWPLIPMKDYLIFVKSLEIPAKHWDAVFYKNAAQLFKIHLTT